MAIGRMFLVEMVQQHHPDMGETEVITRANQAIANFCLKTEISRVRQDIGNTVAGQRYYPSISSTPPLSVTGFLKVYNLWLDDVLLPRLLTKDVAMLIDDDEYSDADNPPATPTQTSKERYWYPIRNRVTLSDVDYNTVQIGIVERFKNAITRHDVTSNYQSVSVTGLQIRIEATTMGDFLTPGAADNATGGRTAFPQAFADAIPYKVIADGYKRGTQKDIQLAQYFDMEYDKLVKEAKKYARSGNIGNGMIVPHSF